MSTEITREKPVYGILSGPSGGVAGALAVARRAGFDDILTFDMGGTSVCLQFGHRGAAIDEVSRETGGNPHPTASRPSECQMARNLLRRGRRCRCDIGTG